MIEFKKKYSLQNGNKITKKNWHKVVAVSLEPNNNCFGHQEVDRIRREKGAYYNKWKLVYEENESPDRCGFIFREINLNHGINGHHKTFREAIRSAIKPYIKVYLADGNEMQNQ